MNGTHTRIWKGYKEYSTNPYYVGQVLIKTGIKKGCYKTVTRECNNEAEADKLLIDKQFARHS
jgi:carbamoylphosphate synthase small subunit